jgi:hypothetical protein
MVKGMRGLVVAALGTLPLLAQAGCAVTLAALQQLAGDPARPLQWTETGGAMIHIAFQAQAGRSGFPGPAGLPTVPLVTKLSPTS